MDKDMTESVIKGVTCSVLRKQIIFLIASVTVYSKK